MVSPTGDKKSFNTIVTIHKRDGHQTDRHRMMAQDTLCSLAAVMRQKSFVQLVNSSRNATREITTYLATNSSQCLSVILSMQVASCVGSGQEYGLVPVFKNCPPRGRQGRYSAVQQGWLTVLAG